MAARLGTARPRTARPGQGGVPAADPEARTAIVLAQDEARLLQHNYIGTEHILLGLLGDGETLAARALQATGISLQAAREQVLGIIGHGQQEPCRAHPVHPAGQEGAGACPP